MSKIGIDIRSEGYYLRRSSYHSDSIHLDIKLKYPLRDLLRGARRGEYTEHQLRELHRLVYTIARQLVKRKIHSGKLRLDFIRLSENDITHDSIAELFTRNDVGELTEIRKYFEHQHLNIETEPEEHLLMHFRRLIFTVVNDNIFRLYQEADPALGKILRNLKIALNKSDNFKFVVKFDEPFLIVSHGDPLAHLRTMDDDTLSREIMTLMRSDPDFPQILLRLYTFLVVQDRYQRCVRLMSLAQAIKAAYAHFNVTETDAVTAEDRSMESDVITLIKETCREITATTKPRYVENGKVDAERFDTYMRAIQDVLKNEFILGTDGTISYYESLNKNNPTITKEEYFEKHRVIFEYLAKISKKRLQKKLRQM